MSAWVLPDHIADVLPSEARHIEELRRELLDTARGYGYELVMPPLLEHLESLLTGTGEALDLLTFKLVDQLSGRMLGLRADTTPQVARIDAHLLNRQGVARLCYCGPVAHTRPDRAYATREPLQFGAEIYGHAGLEADFEVLLLALDCLFAAQLRDLTVDLSDARIVQALLADSALAPAELARIHAALTIKDAGELAALTAKLPAVDREGLQALLQLYGDASVLDEAERVLPNRPALHHALAELRRCAALLGESANVRVDLADLRGYAYYSGVRFSIYAAHGDALVRGGATTRSAPCSAATGRPWASAWTSSNSSRPCRRVRCAPPSAHPGVKTAPCALRSQPCAAAAKRWSALCRATKVKSMSSIATAC